jgi:ferritin
MLSKTMQDAINEQIRNELYSGYLYLAMSAYAESVNLPGFAHWMREQAEEEQEHAMKFYKFVVERGGRVVLHAIDQPPAEFKSPLALFEETLAHEQLVTSMIHNLYALAVKEKDYASQSFLKWYIDEQVEEEAHATEILEQLKMVGDHKMGLLMMDRQLAARS